MKQSRFAVIEFDHEKGVECSAFILDPSGRTVLSFDLSPSKARRVALWDIDSGAMVKCDTFADRLNPSALKASPDHSRIAAANARQIALLDASSLRVVSSIKFPRPACTHNLAWSKDGRMLTRGSWDLEAFCWDVPSGKMISQIAFDDAVEFAAFTEGDAEILLGVGSEVLGWNFRSGKTHRRLKFKDADGYSWEHALSSDRRTLISISERSCLKQTDTRNWKSEKFSAIRSSAGFSFAFSSDSKRVAIGSANGSVFIWDLVERKPWVKWKPQHYDNVGMIAFTPDGERLVCSLNSELFALDFRPGAAGRKREQALPPPGILQCVQMCGPDQRMDETGSRDEPVNPLPIKCSQCNFPDLDFVPQPYYLAKGVDNPADMALAQKGNLLVRERVKETLESVAPGQCAFYPTHHRKTKKTTPWFLAVPVNFELTGVVKHRIPRCPVCGEPRTAHPGSEYEQWEFSPRSRHDIFKSRNWGSFANTSPGKKETSRELAPHHDPARCLLLSPPGDLIQKAPVPRTHPGHRL